MSESTDQETKRIIEELVSAMVEHNKAVLLAKRKASQEFWDNYKGLKSFEVYKRICELDGVDPNAKKEYTAFATYIYNQVEGAELPDVLKEL